MTYLQTMGYIVLPQAFRNMLPVLLTQTIVLFQDTSLVYVLSITDFLGAASKVAQRDGRLVEMYLFAALVYFVISFVASLLVRRLVARGAAAEGGRDHPVRTCHDHAQQSQQVVSQLSGAQSVLDGSRQGRSRRGVRSIGFRQVDAHQMRQWARTVPGRHHHGR